MRVTRIKKGMWYVLNERPHKRKKESENTQTDGKLVSIGGIKGSVNDRLL